MNEDQPITPEEFRERMAQIAAQTVSAEFTHEDADELMAETLRRLGYGEGVGIFVNMEKWYS